MARLHLTVPGDPRAGDTYFVSVEGRLGRRDLKRLGALCGRALEHRPPLLEVRLTGANAIDADARAFVERLRTRGAIIIEQRPRAKAQATAVGAAAPTDELTGRPAPVREIFAGTGRISR
jgi:hypothetical protein